MDAVTPHRGASRQRLFATSTGAERFSDRYDTLKTVLNRTISELIVQLPSKDTAADSAHLSVIESKIKDALAGNDSGAVSGWDFGSGNMNIFVDVHRDRSEQAFDTIRDVLTELGIWDVAVVAAQNGDEAHPDDDELFVVWPSDFEGTFTFW